MLPVVSSSSSSLLPKISQEVLARIVQVFQVHLPESSSKELEEACFQSVLEACRQGKWEQITSCKTELAQLTDQQGRSVLLCVIQSGDRTLSQKLISEGVTLHTYDLEGNTPLHYAALRGDVDLISMLYKHILIDSKNKNGETPLHLAIRAGQSDVVRALLLNGAQKEACFNYETIEVTPLGLAVIRGELESVQILCEEIKPSTTQTSIGNVLHLAVHFQQNEVLRYLLQEHTQDCKTLLEQKVKGHTPFALAVLIDNPQALCLLQAFGANIEATNHLEQTPFYLAVEQRNSTIIEYLFTLGCQIAPIDSNLKRPLDLIIGQDDAALSTRALVTNLMKRNKQFDQKPPQFQCQPPENLVFKGGGPKGIAYLGAVKVLDRKGSLQYVKRVAGTSAGAINSTLMAFNYSYDEMLDLLGNTDIKSWLDHPLTAKSLKESIQRNLSLRGAFDAVKGIVKHLLNPIGLVTAPFRAIWHCTGVCEGSEFLNTCEKYVAEKSGISFCTFGELRGLIEKGKPFRHLHIFATRLSEPPQIIDFNSEDKQWDDVIISHAVRASMSIPVAFVPHIIHKKINGKPKPWTELGSFVDGNFFQGLSEEEKNCPIFNKRTLGFSLYSQEEKELPDPEKIETVGELLLATVGLFYKAEDLLRQMNPYNMHRVIEIDNQGVGLLEFALSDEKKTKLIQSGERATTGFYEKLGGEVQETSLFYLPRVLKEIQRAIHVKPPHPHFVGRTALLQDLDKVLLADALTLLKQSKIHVLYGPGGMGKSELAISFANNHLDDFSLLWTISCGSPEEMAIGYRLLANALKVYLDNHDSQEIIVQKVHSRLAQNTGKPWLIIFDNLNDPVPFPERGGVVLITSYRKKPSVEGTEVLPFSPEEALELLQTVTKQNSPHFARLLEFSGCYPLLLGQMGSYLARTGMSVEEYISLLEQEARPIEPSERNPKTLEVAIELTLQKLPPSALNWLYICSHLNASAIPLSYLEVWLKSIGFQDRATLVLQREDIKIALMEHALLRFDPETKMFSMHLGIKKILRSKDVHTFNEAVKILVALSPEGKFNTTKDWAETMKEVTQWASHIKEILQIAEQVEDGVSGMPEISNEIFSGVDFNFIPYFDEKAGKLSKWEIAHYLWLNEAIKISDVTLQKVNHVAVYLKEKGFELMGVQVDGNCFCNAFLGSYETLSRKIPILDNQKDKISYLRKVIAQQYLSNQGESQVYIENIEREEQIKQNGEWLTTNEGELLATSLDIPIRIIRIDQDEQCHCISDVLTFSEKNREQQDWNTVNENERPKEYVLIIDIGSHFLYAVPLSKAKKGRFAESLEESKKHTFLKCQPEDIVLLLRGMGVWEHACGHYLVAVKYFTQAVKIGKTALGDKDDLIMSFCGMADCYYSQGNYAEAFKLYSQIKKFGKVDGGLNNNIANCYAAQWNFAEAIHLYSKELKRLKAAGGKDSAVGGTLLNIAMCYYDQGNYAEALELSLQALEIQKATLGDKHPNVAVGLHGIAMCYYSQGNYTEAFKLNSQALEIKIAALGDKHPRVASSLNGMAMYYYSQGNYIKALELHSQALEIQEEALMNNHPNLAWSLNGMAMCYYSQGNYREAFKLNSQALGIQKAALMNNHPDVTWSLNGIGKYYYSQGNYVEALELHSQALEIQEAALGDKHPDMATSLNGMAKCYYSQGNYTKAFELHSKALIIQKAVLGDKHPDTAASLNGMAKCYYSQWDYVEALKLNSQALEIQKAALGDKHPDIATSLNGMAKCHYSQGDYVKALKLNLQALKIQKAALLGDKHPAIAMSLNGMANYYYSQGNFAEALKLHSRALEIRKATLGDKHPAVATSLNNMASCYNSQGSSAKALELHWQALEIRIAVLGYKHPDVAISLNNMASCHDSQGSSAEALKLHSQALEIRIATLGDKHPAVAASLNNIERCRKK